ncbi:phosphonate ABC transporter substrate-binding protein [Bacillus pseudomycoides]|nr:2-aminoethylphosphonate ABC transport system, 1-aminoethylphosphonate-binding protein component [Bacillus pseudomycoides]MBD5795566.1 phosphonate ABC transporter substrate-binding protein [Bacillus pseudomycoides]
MELYIRKIKGERKSEKTLFKAVATGGMFSLLMGCGTKKEETAGAKVKDDKLSGSLAAYTAIEEELVPIYLDSFKKKYPDVKLNIVRDSTGVITAKLLAEGKNTQADVVWGIAASSLLALEKKEMLKEYSPKGVDRVLPQFKDDKKPEKWIRDD